MSKINSLWPFETLTFYTGRINFGQFALIGFSILLSTGLCAQTMKQDIELNHLNPFKKIQDRSPSNFIPNDEVWGAPVKDKSFVQKLFVETNEGTLANMKNQFQTWEQTEEYARLWNLDTTGLYVVPTDAEKKSYINRQLLKYADKRLSGEVKNAEEGSTLHAIGQAQEALRPSAEASIAPSVKLKFKARVLEGKAYMIVDNPYVDAQAQVNAQGEASMNVKRSFASLGVTTEVDYQMSSDSWVARLDKSITSNVTARVTSAQSQQDMAFSSESNRTVELVFGMPF